MLLLAVILSSIDSTMPGATVGHIVTSAITGHATILQIALSVRLDQKRNISDQLREFGVTASHNELRRFRISAAVAARNERRALALYKSQTGLVQVIADTFDAQISWGRDIAFRTQDAVSDLHAVDARYHVRSKVQEVKYKNLIPRKCQLF